MKMKAHKIPKLTVAEYLTQEQVSNVKYEYQNGAFFALAGSSLNHGLLCGNIYSELRGKLRTKKSNCKPFTSEIKLNIKDQKSYVYPDTMVICEELETSQFDENSVTNPNSYLSIKNKDSIQQSLYFECPSRVTQAVLRF